MAARGGGADGPARTVIQGGRAKAFRPLPEADRKAAFDGGMAAYARGDFFEAHELLEPAWMGTDDPAERELYQGLIKLAAAYVHLTRGNPAGLRKNLIGARQRLEASLAAAGASPADGRIDVTGLLAAIDARLGEAGERLPPPHLRSNSRAAPSSRGADQGCRRGGLIEARISAPAADQRDERGSA